MLFVKSSRCLLHFMVVFGVFVIVVLYMQTLAFFYTYTRTDIRKHGSFFALTRSLALKITNTSSYLIRLDFDLSISSIRENANKATKKKT